MPYEKPEQPPGDTYTRSALSGVASFFRSCLSWVTAVSVMVSIVSASARESDQFYQDFGSRRKIARWRSGGSLPRASASRTLCTEAERMRGPRVRLADARGNEVSEQLHSG